MGASWSASLSPLRLQSARAWRSIPRHNRWLSHPPRIALRPGVHDPVVLMISRRQVEEADLASVIQGLRPFTATREDAWLYRCQMTLVITGYDDDPREIVDIPEARLFLKNLARDWPYWAPFFDHVDGSLVLLLRSRQTLPRPRRGRDRNRNAEEGAAGRLRRHQRTLRPLRLR
jgi:hypothetical protein